METVAPHSEVLHTLIAVFLVSITSAVGSLSFALGSKLKPAIPYLVSAAAGALLGTSLCSLVPEALEHVHSNSLLGLRLTLGFLLSFVVERLLGMLVTEDPVAHVAVAAGGSQLHHVHERHHSSGKSLVTNILLSGAIHSLVDGIGIAVAFLSSHAAGVAVAVAVILHEVPHHIADIGVLIYSGIPKRRAILLNLLATAGCTIGGVLVLVFGSSANVLTPWLLPITAANFLYIAVGILMPELQHETSQRKSLAQMAVLVASVVLVASMNYYLPENTPKIAQLMR